MSCVTQNELEEVKEELDETLRALDYRVMRLEEPEKYNKEDLKALRENLESMTRLERQTALARDAHYKEKTQLWAAIQNMMENGETIDTQYAALNVLAYMGKRLEALEAAQTPLHNNAVEVENLKREIVELEKRLERAELEARGGFACVDVLEERLKIQEGQNWRTQWENAENRIGTAFDILSAMQQLFGDIPEVAAIYGKLHAALKYPRK